jgi:hypothetical protein
MPVIESLATWLEATQIAQVVGQSMWLVATLSAVHVLGYALVMGGALVANLRLMGVLLRKLPVMEVTRPASRGISVGLVISTVTGVLLVSWKASMAFVSDTFQLKMVLLVAAALLHYTWQRGVIRREVDGAAALKVTGVIGLLLWLGLAVTACAYILFE